MTNTSLMSKTPLRQVQDVRGLLNNEQARQQLAAVAASHMKPERLMRITANAIRTTPKLQQCEPLSFLGALMQCAALGLEPNSVLGHAYLVPFDKNVKGDDNVWRKVPQVQLIIGYKGLIDLARRSGHITSISANIHYDDDELWEYEEGTDSRLRHRPGPQEGKKLHAYAIAKFREGGGHAYVVLPWSHVMKIRDGSQGWQSAVKFGKTESSPWRTHEDAMAQKTAIRALAKYLPMSVEMSDAVAIDADQGARVDYASYALRPEEGAMIEGDFIDHEGEEEEPKPEPEPEKKPARAKPAAKRKEPEPKKEPEPEQEPEAETEPADAGDMEVPEDFTLTVEGIRGDLMDGAGTSGILGFYEEKLEAMKAAHPDFHAALMAEIESYDQ